MREKGRGILGQAQGEGLGNSISVAGVSHVISNPQFEIPTPLPPANFWQVPHK